MFQAARHPANNKAVQMILQRAAYLTGDPTAYDSMIAAAQSLAQLEHPVTSTSSGTDSHQREERHVLRPKSIKGVGDGCCRIALQGVGYEPQPSEVPLASSDMLPLPIATSLPGRTLMPYDECCAIVDCVSRVIAQHFEQNVCVTAVGPHRCGHPFVQSVALLCAHCDIVTRSSPRVDLHYDPSKEAGTACLQPSEKVKQFGDRVIRLLQGHGVVCSGRLKWKDVRLECALEPRNSLHGDGDLLFTRADGYFTHTADTTRACSHFRDNVPHPSRGGSLKRPLSLYFTSFDRFVPQSVLLTGPSEFVSSLLTRASVECQLHLGMEGLFKVAREERCVASEHHSTSRNDSPRRYERVHTPTEQIFFSHLRLPYIHPFNR